MPVESTTGNALAAVEKYYQEYGCRARELKNQGKKIMGYLCAYAPQEIIAAAGFVPVRIKGDVNEPITRADSQMETIICPLVRSCFDLSIKGRYDYIDGIVIPHACDSICRTYDVWNYCLDLPYSHFINMPHSDDESSVGFFQDLLNTFRTSLGKFAGKTISDGDLAQAIRIYNQNRTKVRELYELRKTSPPLISGVEISKLLIGMMALPVEEATTLVSNVIAEVKNRPSSIQPATRIMVVGAEVDDITFIKLIEDTGANVVADDLCPGTRENWPMVNTSLDPIEGIARRYLKELKCPRTYQEPAGDSYPDYLKQRFGHIGQMIRDFKVDGVVLYLYKYCDPFGFEVPAVKSYIESLGTPLLYLEDEYSLSTIARTSTRIQAFLEMIGS